MPLPPLALGTTLGTMARPTRMVPHVEQVVWMRHLGDTERAVVVEVDGPVVEVVDDAGARHVFELHPRTAQYVRRGEPSFGTRLALAGDD